VEVHLETVDPALRCGGPPGDRAYSPDPGSLLCAPPSLRRRPDLRTRCWLRRRAPSRCRDRDRLFRRGVRGDHRPTPCPSTSGSWGSEPVP